MATVTVVAQLTVMHDRIETVRAELLKLVAATRTEEGCSEYRLHQDLDNPALFIFYENWQTMACLERHLQSPHFQAYIAAVDGMIAHKTVHKLAECAPVVP
jgi:quinol monooxygenase YgiN